MTFTGPLPDDTWPVLKHAWKWGGIALQSNFARQHATTVALMASQGWLSTIDPDGTAYRGHWRLTQAGLTALGNKEHFT